MLIAMGVLALPVAAYPQARTPRIGLLLVGSASSEAPFVEAFRQGLRDLAYTDEVIK
jgi:hypothetical protein